MAFLMTKQLENGLVVQSAYARVDSIMGYKGGMDFSLNYYTSSQAFEEGRPYLQQEIHQFIPSVEDGAENFIKQAYEYLRTLPEFQFAVNV